MKQKQKLIVIVGPNASGKSDLAVRLAKHVHGEIISGDSRQIYRGLNIGTGKITKQGMRGIPHHLLDIASPHRRFTVVDFKRRAEKAIHEIQKRNHTPIVVGGTGFWIDTLVYDRTIPGVLPNPRLRTQLEKKSAMDLLAILKKFDPRRASTIEQKNPRRLIRAIEIAKAIGKVPELKESSPYDVLWLGVKLLGPLHEKRIHVRLVSRLRGGMVMEAQKLRRQGLAWKRFFELGLEYRYLALYLQKKISKEQMAEELERAIRDYARRQMTWFKRNKKIRWLQNTRSFERLVKTFLKTS